MQMLSERELGGDANSAFPSQGGWGGQGLLPAVLSKLLQVTVCVGNLNVGGRKKGRTFQLPC